MAKIYNEIVIDMNPESPTFEETLYEDSFEYSEGDMMLMQGVHEGEKIIVGNPISGDDKSSFIYQTYVYSGDQWVKSDTISWDEWQTAGGYGGEIKHFTTLGEAPSYIEKEKSGWGAQNITKDMFVNPDGTPRTRKEVYTTLDPILTGISGKELVNYINDILPQFTGVPEKEREFVKEGFKADVYEVSKAAGEVGKQRQQAYGSGMGSSMRGAVGEGKDVAQQFKQAEQGYAQDIYGLEKGVAEAYETDVFGALDPEHFADPGASAETTPWASFMGREGGRVPSKSETFLDFLTQLPDAGGM